MHDALDPIAVFLRLVGAFYAFAGVVAGRAALSSGVMDAALAGISGKSPSFREKALTWWLTAAAWTVFASGVLLMVLAREAMWAFIFCALTQAFYLTIAAPYYFDMDDPPDATGRRQTTNAFFIYLAATLLVVWASGRHLSPISALHPVLAWGAAAAIAAFAAHLIWRSVTTSQMPKISRMNAHEDRAAEAVEGPDPPRWFDPRMLRIELTRDMGAWPLKNQKTGEPIDPESLPLSSALKADLMTWFRDGDPEFTGRVTGLAERLASECPDIAVAIPGIENAYVGIQVDSPYCDPSSAAPNWDRMTAIKIMCDYECMPIWAANSGAVGCFPPNFLSISSDLEDALLNWQDRFDASLDLSDPTQPKWDDVQFAAHEREGFELARRVKVERPDLKVCVNSARGVLAVDVSVQSDQWRIGDSAAEG